MYLFCYSYSKIPSLVYNVEIKKIKTKERNIKIVVNTNNVYKYVTYMYKYVNMYK